MWAEIKYGDKTGWVAAEYLNLEKPSETDNSSVTKPKNNVNTAPEKPEEKPEEKNKTEPGTRYVGEKSISMRAKAGFRGHTKDTIEYGQSVEFTGNSEVLDGIKWAEVKHDGKTGWVIANSLRTKRSSDMPYGVDLSDHEGLQNSFDEATVGFTETNLQCVFLTKWFLNNYTTLQTSRGNGFEQVENTFKANSDKDLQISTIPSAPAIYSMDKKSPGFGIRNLTDEKAGHTGVILSVKSNNESENPLECTYDIVYFDTYSSLYNSSHRSRLEIKKGVKPAEHITYLNVGKYLK